jgi:predicted RNA-binding Zn-ribbon protein involved in translation (DUF1610 family)
MPRRAFENFRGWLTGPAHFGPDAKTLLGFTATLLAAMVLLRIPWTQHGTGRTGSATVYRWVWDSPQRGEPDTVGGLLVSTVDVGALARQAIIAAVVFGLVWLVLRGVVQSVRRHSGQCWRCGSQLEGESVEACPVCGERLERPGRIPPPDPDQRRCSACGYDMRGSVSNRCPECGTKMVR